MDKLIFEGIVKTGASQTFIIADDNTFETFHGWIHKHTDKLEGKKVRITIEEVEKSSWH